MTAAQIEGLFTLLAMGSAFIAVFGLTWFGTWIYYRRQK